MSVIRHDVNAARYRALALAAQEARDGAVLDHVRAKHDHAAGIWLTLADGEDQRGAPAPFRGVQAPLLKDD